MKLIIILIFKFLFIFNILFSQIIKLRHGDLLFQRINCGPFCEAVDHVTPAYKGYHVNHVGIVIFKDNEISILEAISKGITFTSLDSFLLRSNKIYVGRVPNKYIPSNDDLKPFINKPYDSIFDITNNAYYCSELAFFLYRNKRQNRYFFSLHPMTFKEPNKHKFFSVWVDYFNKMNVSIPEGKPGLNPGGMMHEKRIKIYSFFKE